MNLIIYNILTVNFHNQKISHMTCHIHLILINMYTHVILINMLLSDANMWLFIFSCHRININIWAHRHSTRHTEAFIQVSKKLTMHKNMMGTFAVSKLQGPWSDFKLRLLYVLRFRGSPVSSLFPKTSVVPFNTSKGQLIKAWITVHWPDFLLFIYFLCRLEEQLSRVPP